MSRWRWRRGARSRPMDCAQVMELLQAALDGELDPPTAHRAAAHLAECHGCGLEAATYREIKRALRRHRSPDPAAVRRLHDYGQTLLGGPEGGGSGRP